MSMVLEACWVRKVSMLVEIKIYFCSEIWRRRSWNNAVYGKACIAVSLSLEKDTLRALQMFSCYDGSNMNEFAIGIYGICWRNAYRNFWFLISRLWMRKGLQESYLIRLFTMHNKNLTSNLFQSLFEWEQEVQLTHCHRQEDYKIIGVLKPSLQKWNNAASSKMIYRFISLWWRKGLFVPSKGLRFAYCEMWGLLAMIFSSIVSKVLKLAHGTKFDCYYRKKNASAEFKKSCW